jgi:O-antigen/teichoic acid export membrane protein
MDTNDKSAAPDATVDSRHLTKKTLHAAGWNYASFGLGKLVVLITITILARLLNPEEFGIVAFASLAVAYLSVLKDFGLGSALIQRRSDIEEASHTVFTINLVMGICLTLVVIAIAPLVADFFHEPQVEPLLQVLSLTFSIEALGAVHVALLQRHLDFRRKLIPDLGRAIIKGIVSIGMAVAGYGVWSLIVGQLAGVAVSVILAWVVYPWIPRLRIEWKLVGSLLAFGIPIMGVAILHAIGANLGYTIIGRHLGDVALGIFTMAYRIPDLLVNSIWRVLARVIFPAFSVVQHDMHLLQQGFLGTIRYVQIVVVPISLMVILAADPLVHVLLGPDWVDAIPILRLIAVYALISSIGTNIGDVYKAIGQAGMLWKLGILNITVLAVCIAIGLKYGLAGIAIGHIVAGIQAMLTRLYFATRVLNITAMDIVQQMRPSFTGGLTLSLTAIAVLYLAADLNATLQLVMVSVAAGLGYIAAMWIFERDSVINILNTVGLAKILRKQHAAVEN